MPRSTSGMPESIWFESISSLRWAELCLKCSGTARNAASSGEQYDPFSLFIPFAISLLFLLLRFDNSSSIYLTLKVISILVYDIIYYIIYLYQVIVYYSIYFYQYYQDSNK